MGGQLVTSFVFVAALMMRRQPSLWTPCISDELAPLFISHHHLLQLDTLSLSLPVRVLVAHTGMHMQSHTQTHTHPEAPHFENISITFTPMCRVTDCVSLLLTDMTGCIINGASSLFPPLFPLILVKCTIYCSDINVQSESRAWWSSACAKATMLFVVVMCSRQWTENPRDISVTAALTLLHPH